MFGISDWSDEVVDFLLVDGFGDFFIRGRGRRRGRRGERVGYVGCWWDCGGEDTERFVGRRGGVGGWTTGGEVGVGADGWVCVENFRHFQLLEC